MKTETLSPAKRQRTRLRMALKAQAYTILSTLPSVPERPLLIVASDKEVRVVVQVSIEGQAVEVPGAAEGIAGLFLSPIEAAIVSVIKGAGDKALSGKVIAKRVSQPYTATLKFVLKNLKDRQIIQHKINEGYRLFGGESRA